MGGAKVRGAVKDGTELEEAVKTGQLNDQLAVELFIIQYSSKKNANERGTL